MRTKIKVATIALAVPAFLLNPVLFPPAEDGLIPTPSQMAHLLSLSVGDVLLLGLGVAFLLLRTAGATQVSPTESQGVGNVTLYRLPDGLLVAAPGHARNSLDLQGLMMLDYVFHSPLEVAGVVLAWSFFSPFRSWRNGKLTAVEANEMDSLADTPVR